MTSALISATCTMASVRRKRKKTGESAANARNFASEKGVIAVDVRPRVWPPVDFECLLNAFLAFDRHCILHGHPIGEGRHHFQRLWRYANSNQSLGCILCVPDVELGKGLAQLDTVEPVHKTSRGRNRRTHEQQRDVDFFHVGFGRGSAVFCSIFVTKKMQLSSLSARPQPG